MRAAAKWAIAGGGALLVGLLAGLGWYEHKTTASGSNGPPHLIPIGFNPGGGAVVNVPLADAQTTANIKASVGDILNIVLPVGASILSASYGKVAWGTGAAPGSKVVSVKLSGPTVVSITWTDLVSIKYTTQVQVAT